MTRFRCTRGLWEHLTRKSVNSDVITNNNIKAYKSIRELTSAYLAGHESGGDIEISRGAKYAKAISKLFPHTRRRAALLHRWTPCQWLSQFHDGRYSIVLNAVPPLCFLNNTEGGGCHEIKVQTRYQFMALETGFIRMHRPVRKRFPRNPYTVTNVMDVWECDLMDMQSLSTYND